MSDNIPFEIQAQIIKSLPVKSLIQFRSVSKPWKSLIDTYDFISRHCAQNTYLQHLLITYDDPVDSEKKYVSIADDDTFPQKKTFLTIPLLVNMLKYSVIIGSSHGLLCLYSDYPTNMVVLWNLSIRKAVAVVVPNVQNGMTYGTVLGFGVCRVTSDPKIVKITYIDRWSDMESISSIPWQVEVFALSTGIWRSPYGNLLRKSIHFDACSCSVVIDGIVYWLATDKVVVNGGFVYYNLIVSFDMTSEEFGEVYLPDSLANLDDYNLSISKLRKYLVVLECFRNDKGYGVWMMLDNDPNSFVLNPFVRLFTINSPVASVRGFWKRGEPIIEYVEDDHTLLVVYEPYSKDVTNLEIDPFAHSFCVHPYVETLLLLDQPDFIIYDKGEAILQREEQIRDAFEAYKQGINK